MTGAFLEVSALTSRLHELVSDHPDFEVLGAPAFSGYCFRYLPNSLADRRDEPEVERRLDQLNQEIADAVRRRGAPHPVITIAIRKRIALHISICRETLPEDVDATFEAVARWGRLLTKTHFNHETLREVEAELCLSESHFSSTEVSAT